MADQLGPITITDPPVLAKFPVTVDWGGGIDYNPPVSVHIFDAPDLKTEQRFVMGSGVPRLRVRRDHLNKDEYSLLRSHYLQAQGQYASFPIDVWVGPKGMETWNVRYENPSIAFDQLAGMLTGDPGLTLLAMPQTLAPYTSVAQVTRFPDSTFETALTAQVQHIFPLLTIQDQARDSSGNLINPPALISNQRVTVDTKTYLPRLITWSGLTQTLDEASDSIQFTLGNADDAFTKYANQVNLYRAAVQFSLFHAESGYLCYIWGGYAQLWNLDTSGRFVLPCSSGTFELTLGYPTRIITRTCWKVYRGRFCPASATNGFATCPKDYDSCVARGVKESFGGVVVPHQVFNTKDSSTGVMGWGRSWMKSVTISNDTIYQNVVPEVYTDEPMQIPAPVMGGRDENTFYAAIGIVSDGPLGAYDSNLFIQQLDNQPPHDPLNNGGFRGVLGNDPANTNSEFLGISIAQKDGSGNITWNLPPPDCTYSAGLAFAEIRRTDAAGLQLAATTDHSMTVWVTKGVSGWTWSAPGSRNWFSGLSNPVWIAVNAYLRALGLRCDPAHATLIPAATMEQYFDVNAAINAAAICDLQVKKIIPDDGTMENQFPFRGILKERKPLKDWLTEILNNCLGYWTFVNGKLWIGIRENAGAKDAFTRAHLKWKTLQIVPIRPQFNWLVVEFGDEEFNWTLNNVTAYDIDHAMLVGTADSPQYLSSTMTMVGVSNLSQAARIAITRLREEVGGYVVRDGSGNITDNQLARARNFSFSTTVLALKNMVGDVISLTHPLLPTSPQGYIKGRIQSWTLNPDFSIDIQASFATDEMYDMDAGPKPQDVKPPPIPIPKLAWIQGAAWMPDLAAPQAGDPVYYDPLERSFAMWQDYFIAADGSWAPAIFISGYLPANQFVDIFAPEITDLSIQTGGNLVGGYTYYFCMVCYDSTGKPTKLSNLGAIWVPVTTPSGNAIALSFLPPLTGTWAGWELYAGLDRRSLARQAGGSGAVPATYTFNGPVHPYTLGIPTPYAQYVQVGVKHVFHAGVAGLRVDSPPTTNTIQSDDFIGSNDPWNGRIVSIIGDATTGRTELLNYSITAFDSSTGTITVSPNCVISGDPEHSVEQNDVLIVRSLPASVSSDYLTITDPLWNNSVGLAQSGNAPGWDGLTPSAEKGNVMRVLRGTGQGNTANILDNTNTSVTLATPLYPLDSTSILIIEESNWNTVGFSSPQPVAVNQKNLAQIRIPVDNLAQGIALVGAFLNDGANHLTDAPFAVYRDIFIFGQPPNVRTVGPGAGPWDALATDQTIKVANENNDVTIQLPPLADYAGRTLLIFSNGANNVIINTATGETFFDNSTSQNITGVGATIRITSTGQYDLAAQRKRMRALRK